MTNNVLLYDPHPGGIFGCPMPLPEHIKKAIDQLECVEMPLNLAVEKLNRITDGEITVHNAVHNDNFIALELTMADGSINCWRLLRFCEVENVW